MGQILVASLIDVDYKMILPPVQNPKLGSSMLLLFTFSVERLKIPLMHVSSAPLLSNCIYKE